MLILVGYLFLNLKEMEGCVMNKLLLADLAATNGNIQTNCIVSDVTSPSDTYNNFKSS
jgi:hypothetical protein